MLEVKQIGTTGNRCSYLNALTLRYMYQRESAWISSTKSFACLLGKFYQFKQYIYHYSSECNWVLFQLSLQSFLDNKLNGKRHSSIKVRTHSESRQYTHNFIFAHLVLWIGNFRSIAYHRLELEILKNGQELHLISHLTKITASLRA